jgi:hypothetical protein
MANEITKAVKTGGKVAVLGPMISNCPVVQQLVRNGFQLESKDLLFIYPFFSRVFILTKSPSAEPEKLKVNGYFPFTPLPPKQFSSSLPFIHLLVAYSLYAVIIGLTYHFWPQLNVPTWVREESWNRVSGFMTANICNFYYNSVIDL